MASKAFGHLIKTGALSLALFLCGCIGKHSPDAQSVIITETNEKAVQTLGDTLDVNLVKSSMSWKGTKMRGAGKHEGEISWKRAYFLLRDDSLVGGAFTIDMRSIRITDMPEHETEARRNLTDHLSSPDFFDVERFPESTFEVTRIKYLEANELEIIGALTIKDVTRDISFKGNYADGVFTTRFAIDRFLWNIAYQGSWTDKTFVDPDIQFTITLKIL